MAKSLKKTLKNFIPEDLWSHLRDSKHTSVDSFHRLLAKQLLEAEDDERVGLAHYFEVQPHSPQVVIRGYMQGLFPSALSDDGHVTWHSPDPRGVIPIMEFHVPSTTRSFLRKEPYDILTDKHFRQVMENCAEGRGRTHITEPYMAVYEQLYEMGVAHSVSVWEGDVMVGGAFGVAIGGYFAGESNFQRAKDASKIALTRIAEILAHGGFVLHDSWWHKPHMEQFGGYAVSREEFEALHVQAMITQARFDADAPRSWTLGEKNLS